MFQIFILSSIIFTIVVTLFYFNRKDVTIGDAIENEIMLLKLKQETISFNLSNIISDLLFLSHQNEISNYINTGNEELFNDIEKEYYTFIKNNNSYAQLRFIDNSGLEIVRLNKKNDKIDRVNKNLLQNKSSRYYFTETMKLDHDEVFISPLDLNVEKGEIEEPYSPMIRFATPILKGSERLGIIIINYYSDGFLKKLRSLNLTSVGEFYFLNHNSDFIISPNSEDEWNFMFNEKKGSGFKSRYPVIWSNIIENGSGFVQDKSDIFVFRTIYPFPAVINHSVAYNNSKFNNYNFKLITRIDKRELLLNLQSNVLKFYFLVCFFLLLISFLIAKISIDRKKNYESNLELARINSVLAMIVTVNHEINQPLTSLEGNIEMLKLTIDENKLTDKQRKYLSRSLESCEQINQILTKFRESHDIKFTDYTDNVEMVSFDDFD